jgi:hypothetical protein
MSDSTIDRTSRRRFLGGAAAVGLAAAALPGRAGAAGTRPAGRRSAAQQYASSRFQLELAGEPSGFVAGVEGGDAYAPVVTDKTGAKQLGRVAFDDVGFRVGLSMGSRMYEWIELTLRGRQPRLDGSIVEATYELEAVERRDFSQALISEIGFPALDVASNDQAALSVKLAAEQVRFRRAGGQLKPPLVKGKQWLASAFRLELDGIDTSYVTRIDPFSITQRPGEGLVLPDLTVTFGAGNTDALVQWHESFVIRGSNSPDAEKRGAIVFLAPDRSQELGRLDLSNVGISRLVRTTDASGRKRLTASLYVERMGFRVKDA